MSPEDAEAPSRYRPVGRNRFGLVLVALAIGSGLVVWLSWRILGESRGHDAIMLALGLSWMAGSVRPILRPGRVRRDWVEQTGTGPSLQRIRIENIVVLIVATVVVTLSVQDLLYPPPPASGSVFQTPY